MKFSSTLFGAVVSLGLLGNAAPIPAAEELRFESRPGRQTRLVELYTSEGCSSCPPAESWLSKWVASPQLWTGIVPVAFHVDYWDNLGWHDRFATPAWSARQRAYAQTWGNTSVYTPGLALDGREWRDWRASRSGSLSEIPTQNAGRLSAVVKDGKMLTVVYHPAKQPSTGLTVTAALLGCDLSSNVKAGENRGRSLRHDFVALWCETKALPVDREAGESVFALQMPSEDAKHLALAVWIEAPGGAGVMQAVGGWLNSPAPASP